MTQVQRYLEKASDLLRARGWCQGKLYISNGVDNIKDADQFCALGAIDAVIIDLKTYNQLETKLVKALHAAIPKTVGRNMEGFNFIRGAVADYNDDHLTSKRQVLAWFRRAIKLAEA